MSRSHAHRSTRWHAWSLNKDMQCLSPAWPLRRSERAEIQFELIELELSEYDPNVLLWGGLLATTKDMFRRARRLGAPLHWSDRYYEDVWNYYPSDSDWDEFLFDTRHYDYLGSYDDYNERWEPDPRDAAWVDQWLAGKVHADDQYDWYSVDDYYDGYVECGYWVGDEIDWSQINIPDYPGDLGAERERERQTASRRGRMRSAARR